MKNRVYFLDNLRTFLIFLVVLYHAGFSYQSALQSNWIVVDNDRNESIGLIGLYLDVFIMAVMFFISGYFISNSVSNRSSMEFVKTKFKRIMIPWGLAVLTLIPAYKVLFLYSRGLPQESLYTYFHIFKRTGSDLAFFANDPSQHWLWFLPVLFLFQISYLVLYKAGILSIKVSFKWSVISVLVLGITYSMVIAVSGYKGWFLGWIFDFQRERLLVYFLFFLLGSSAYKSNLFSSAPMLKNTVFWNVLLAFGITVYTIIALNLYGNMVDTARNFYFISQRVDGLLYYSSVILLMLSFLFILLDIFRRYFNNTRPWLTLLNRGSYNIYIIHMIALGFIALWLTQFDIPAFGKYLILAVTTFFACSVIAIAYQRWFQGSIWLRTVTTSALIFALFAFISLNRSEGSNTNSMSMVQIPTMGLHEAAITGNVEAIWTHIENGSDLDEREASGGSSPLISAIVFGQKEVALLLIHAGADVDFRNNEGSTPLHTAAFFCRDDIVKALLENGADKSIRNQYGSTPFDSVNGPYGSVVDIYQYFEKVLGPLGLKLDYDRIKVTRPIIAEMLQDTY